MKKKELSKKDSNQGKEKNHSRAYSMAKLVLHLVIIFSSLGIILYLWLPWAKLYYNFSPALGIDLYLSVSFTSFLKRFLNFPWLLWFYPWYGGSPFYTVYPYLHFYLVLPFAYFLGVVKGVQFEILFTLFLYLASAYLLFREISKNYILSFLLTLATAASFNLYSPLFWSGSMPYIGTIFLLPLSLFLVLKYCRSKNKKYFYLLIFSTGAGMMIHPQAFIGWIIPLTSLEILLWKDEKTHLLSFEKIKILLKYWFGVISLALPYFFLFWANVLEVFNNIFKIFKVVTNRLSEQSSYIAREAQHVEVASPEQKLNDILNRSNLFFKEALVILGVIFLLVLILKIIFKQKRENLWLAGIFGITAIYSYVFIYGFILGINPLVGGWFRAFWPVMIIMGALIAVLWRNLADIFKALADKLAGQNKIFKFSFFTLSLIFQISLGIIGYQIIQKDTPKQQEDILGYQEESSAYPTTLSQKTSREEWPEYFSRLVPSWLDPNRLDFRLYEMDAEINIWWTSLFNMPLARGYLDSPRAGPNYLGWQYWANVTYSRDEIVERFEMPEEWAKNQALFLIDWHAIKYFEAENAYFREWSSPLSSYLNNPEIIKRDELLEFTIPPRQRRREGRTWESTEYQEALRYFEINDQYTSPIYQATSAKTIGIFAPSDGLDIVMRLLASLPNYNSQKIIPIHLSDELDNVSFSELKNFDMLFLYNYTGGSNKVWSNLERYVREGGKIFIDTGKEAKESEGLDLPEIIPFESLERKPQGNTWDLKTENHEVWEGVNIDKFAPPVYDNEGWSFSYAPEGGLREGAKILLENYGKPILAKRQLGEGEIFWSGMNLPYHIVRYKQGDELRLFQNMFDDLVNTSQIDPYQSNFERPSPQKVIVKGQGAKGVLFKETNYPGWHARLKAEGFSKKLKIYRVGPQDPGYMYAFIPKEVQNKPFEVVFSYKGDFAGWFLHLASLLMYLFFLDLLLFRRFFSRLFLKLVSPLRAKVSSWWDKEE